MVGTGRAITKDGGSIPNDSETEKAHVNGKVVPTRAVPCIGISHINSLYTNIDIDKPILENIDVDLRTFSKVRKFATKMALR